MGRDEGAAALLLYAAAINYARWHQAWSNEFSKLTPEGLATFQRTGDEARAQLCERARAYVLAPGRA